MRKVFLILGACVAALAAAVSLAAAEAAADEEVATKEARRQCSASADEEGFGKYDVVVPSGETHIAGDVTWRRYIRVHCFIDKVERQHEIQFAPQYAVWF